MKRKKHKNILPILLAIATLFMGIGYAAVNGISLDIAGLLSSKPQDGIFITSIECISNIDTDAANNKITIDYQTLVNNNIVLSDTNKDSSITYQITVYNSTNDIYAYYDTLYSNEELFYDNQDIVVITNGINKWDEIASKGSITFTVTFKYKDGIENITNNELNAIINFKFSKYYNITYKNLDYENKVNNNYPTRVFEGEDLNITFVNNIPDFVEISGTNSFNYKKPNLVITNIENDITITGNIVYMLDTYTFNGTSDIVNTGVALFSDENINKNFKITFDIDEYGENEDFATIINSLYEAGNGWPGFLIRLQSYDGALKLYYDSNCTGGLEHKRFYDFEEIEKVEIIRIDNVIYYSFNYGEYVEAIDYSTLDMTFDTPVSFGATLDGEGNPFRFFQGTLSNMVIKFLEDDSQLDKMYKYDGEKTFVGNANGVTDYIDTEMYLFSEENRDKNFEIYFEIIQSEYVDAATLVNVLDESGEPYSGVLLRYWNNQFQVTANVNNDNKFEYFFPYENVQTIRLVKINGILYLIVNNDAPVYINDFSDFDGNLDDIPVTFGASLNENKEPWRVFEGTLANMLVRYLDESITIDDYVKYNP